MEVPGPPWQLLMKQDTDVALFDQASKTSFLMNPGRPDSGAYSIVGHLDPADPALKSDGLYHFILYYNRGKSGEARLEWKQSSWLTDTSPKGLVPISPANLTEAVQGDDSFRGLARSSCGQAVFDGDGHDRTSWWNAVGVIGKFGHGIPAWHRQVATTYELYICCPHGKPSLKKPREVSSSQLELIMKQDTDVALFDIASKTTFLMNPERPDSGAYSIVGHLDPADPALKSDGLYHFILYYNRGKSGEARLEWKQSSWLTDTSPKGLVPISPANLTEAVQGDDSFRGLARSSSGQAVFDGDGQDCPSWWNAVGVIQKFGHGIPAWHRQVATTYELYICCPHGKPSVKKPREVSSPPWQLIMKQDTDVAVFDEASKTSFLMNPERPDSGAYSIVGHLDPADPTLKSDGLYHFILVYNRGKNGEARLEWKQSSWLTDKSPRGLVPISPPNLTEAVQGDDSFHGLARSSSREAVFDGDGHDRSSWWNAAGVLHKFCGRSIPAWHRQEATTMELYICHPWQLIMKQDTDVALFDDASKTSLLMNPERPDSGAYSIVGYLDPTDPDLKHGGLYHFTLVYNRGKSGEARLEWKQSSWLTDTSPKGLVPISPPNLTEAVQEDDSFRGLARSSSREAVFDGDGHDRGSWWNAVGVVHKFCGRSIPAWHRQEATTMELYISCPRDLKKPRELLSPPWKLIMKQDTDVALFDDASKTSFLMNPARPDSGAYSIVGHLDPADPALKDDGLYHFTLVYNRGKSGEARLEWKQSSWLTDTSPKGLVPIRPPNLTEAVQGDDSFHGLAKSSSREAVFDGDGHDRGSWWNAVGVIHKFCGRSIPAWHRQEATTMELYIHCSRGTLDMNRSVERRPSGIQRQSSRRVAQEDTDVRDDEKEFAADGKMESAAVATKESAAALGQRLTDVAREPLGVLSPIVGVMKTPRKTLLEAAAMTGVDDIDTFAFVATEKGKRLAKTDPHGLDCDEAAALFLYTMESEFYTTVNGILRDCDRSALKPFYPFLLLMLSARSKLPAYAGPVWRGVKGVDLRDDYPKGAEVFWWAFSSTTKELDTLKNPQFLGTSGTRTIFMIDVHSGVDIERYSAFQGKASETEVLLFPGTKLQVVASMETGADLYLVHLKELDVPVKLIK